MLIDVPLIRTAINEMIILISVQYKQVGSSTYTSADITN